MEKKLQQAEATIEKLANPEEDDDDQDDDEDVVGEVEGNPKSWRTEIDNHEKDNKLLKLQIANKSYGPKKIAKWEADLAANIADIRALKQQLWDSECPQVQLDHKFARSGRIKKDQPKLRARIQEAAHNQELAQAEADKYEAEVAELLAKHRRNEVEIERLNTESN